MHLARYTYKTQFEFRISPSLTTKPQAEQSLKTADNYEDSVEQPTTFGPGSDISRGVPGLLILTVNNTHHFVFNKFCVYRPQFLLLTADSFRRQHEPLNYEDLAAAWAVLHGLNTPHYVMYNCTPAAGASREHKHVHVIIRPESDQHTVDRFRMFPDDETLESKNIPFKYFIERFRLAGTEQKAAGVVLKRKYDMLLNKTRVALGITNSEDICPHHMILVNEWMLLIPRRRADVEGASANAAGMLGMVWVPSEAQVDKWKALGPAKVLSQLGVSPVRGEIHLCT